eukprot:6187422-Pleurochrysis_carterae.AAC.3
MGSVTLLAGAVTLLAGAVSINDFLIDGASASCSENCTRTSRRLCLQEREFIDADTEHVGRDCGHPTKLRPDAT